MSITFKTRTSTTYIVTLPDGTELEVPFAPSSSMEYREFLLRRTEDKIVLGYLADDSEGATGYYFDEFEQGEFYNLGNHRVLPKVTKEDPEDLYERLCGEHPGRVFLVDVYEHGMSKYSLSGEGPNCRWDTARGAFIYVAPDDATDPEAYARSVMEEYTDWCNGNIYGTVVVTYERQEDGSWEQVEGEDACWGYIGLDSAYEQLKDEMPKEETPAES